MTCLPAKRAAFAIGKWNFGNTGNKVTIKFPNVTGITTGICSAMSCQRGELFNVGGDAVYRHPIGNGQAVEFEAQADWGGYQNRFGVLHIAAARAQGYGSLDHSALLKVIETLAGPDEV